MVFRISHTTEYTYSGKVFFEPHCLRFKPKDHLHLNVRDFDIRVEPEPSGLSGQFDVENNHNLLCWFEGMHTQLKIISHLVVERHDFNPFDFLVYPAEYLLHPFEYEKRMKQLLLPSLQSMPVSASMTEYCRDLLEKANHQSVEFLMQFTKSIYENFGLKSRMTGNPHEPEITFNGKTGSCRDLAWMQIHMLRHLGIASRFVSGYYYVNAENPEYELHAWVEAYLPGAGWIGLDPSHGMLANEHHIPIASSAFYENTMPVSGTVRGDANAELKHTLEIDLIN